MLEVEKLLKSGKESDESGDEDIYNHETNFDMLLDANVRKARSSQAPRLYRPSEMIEKSKSEIEQK